MEKEMATHSSILAWELPWTGEPGRLQSMESLVGCSLWDPWRAAVYGIPGRLQFMGSLAGCGLWDPWRAAVCGIAESGTTEHACTSLQYCDLVIALLKTVKSCLLSSELRISS